VRNGLCSAFGSWKNEKNGGILLKPLRNAWPMLVRQSLHTLQGAKYSSWLLQVKNDVKSKAQLKRCAPYCAICN
jgi:hypothetical protein